MIHFLCRSAGIGKSRRRLVQKESFNFLFPSTLREVTARNPKWRRNNCFSFLLCHQWQLAWRNIYSYCSEKGSALHRSIENDCPNGFFLVSITLLKVVFTAVEGVNLKAPSLEAYRCEKLSFYYKNKICFLGGTRWPSFGKLFLQVYQNKSLGFKCLFEAVHKRVKN